MTTTDTPDPTVVALGRAVERALRRLGELDGNLRQLAADVLALADRLGTTEPAGEAPGVRSWLLAADAEQAAADLADLVAWIGQVYLRYDDTTLAPCWLWHPDVVEELWWLRRAHADAYDPQRGSWLRAGEWHDRQRPGVTRRLKHLQRCDLSRHTRPTPHVETPLAGHAAAIAAAWTADRAAPQPTEPQLVEAARHQERQFQAQRSGR